MVIRASTTLYYNGQFWCILFEMEDDSGRYVSQEVLGAEPGSAELINWIHKNGSALIEKAVCSSPIHSDIEQYSYKKINPKRAARIAAKEARVAKLSTASQEALARQRDDLKKTASANKKREKDEHEKYVRSVRRAKAKEKHKGH
ncbi:PF11208 family protein [Propionibacterium acidifaciens F0233]|uniref:PF11208 family protein n=2 Tax=Propionibacterium acidifaciens TaxID=556499 RepID=U2Q8W0_9ACTN|nr:YjdF family protein [Propionibacterium acidifaciens]AYW78464.1 DUF2992 family protein [Propionibacterium acidifaciens]ERK52499.1 PF11208 family protein [Propionibacterium acidifaciens F0233]